MHGHQVFYDMGLPSKCSMTCQSSQHPTLHCSSPLLPYTHCSNWLLSYTGITLLPTFSSHLLKLVIIELLCTACSQQPLWEILRSVLTPTLWCQSYNTWYSCGLCSQISYFWNGSFVMCIFTLRETGKDARGVAWKSVSVIKRGSPHLVFGPQSLALREEKLKEVSKVKLTVSHPLWLTPCECQCRR